MNVQAIASTATDVASRKRRRRTLLVALFAVVAVWIAAFCIVSAARLAATMYTSFGADLPAPTLLVIAAAQNDLPWGYALLCTLLLSYLALRFGKHLAWACALLMTLTTICVSYAAFSLFMPVSKCGDFWPDWPDSSATAVPSAPPVASGSPDAVPPGANARRSNCTV